MSVQIRVRGNIGNISLKPIRNAQNPEEPSLVLNFSIASSNFRKNKDGQYEAVGDTEWIACDYWNRNADHLYKLFQVGMPVIAEGEERIEQFTNSDGVEMRVRKLRVSDVFIVPTERVQSIVLRAKREQSASSATPDSVPTDNEDQGSPF